MPYITIPVRQKEYQISFDDILNGINESFFARMMDDKFRIELPKG